MLRKIFNRISGRSKIEPAPESKTLEPLFHELKDSSVDTDVGGLVQELKEPQGRTRVARSSVDRMFIDFRAGSKATAARKTPNVRTAGGRARNAVISAPYTAPSSSVARQSDNSDLTTALFLNPLSPLSPLHNSVFGEPTRVQDSTVYSAPEPTPVHNSSLACTSDSSTWGSSYDSSSSSSSSYDSGSSYTSSYDSSSSSSYDSSSSSSFDSGSGSSW